MFRKMRRSEKQLDLEASLQILEQGEYGTLSTISTNGYPYGIPMNYVYYKECIYFHCAGEGHKLENIKNDPKVSFCVVSDVELLPEKFSTKFTSVVVFGRTIEVKGSEKVEGLKALVSKYSPEYIEEGDRYIERAKAKTTIVKIEIDQISGKSNRF